MAAIKNVVLVGAGGGILGPIVLKEFLSAATFNITVISRESSSSTFPASVKVIKSDYSPSSLQSAFSGQDAVVSLVGKGALLEQQKLVDAALAAGVKRFVPSEFGNNTADARVRKLAPLLEGKKAVVDYLKTKEDQISWTALITGPFADSGLKSGFLGFLPAQKTVRIFDSGSVPASITTLPQIGRALVAALSHASLTANKYVYVESFTVTQRDILAAAEKASGGEKWKVENADLKPLVAQGLEKFKGGDMSGVGHLLIASGFGEHADGPYGDWKVVEGGSWNERLGLKEESLDEVVKAAVV